jgi:hypothetical protein
MLVFVAVDRLVEVLMLLFNTVLSDTLLLFTVLADVLTLLLLFVAVLVETLL